MKQAGIKSFFALPRTLLEEIRTVAVSFAFLTAIGYILALVRPDSVKPLLSLFTEAAASIGIYDVDQMALMVTILSNNLLSLLVIIASGLIPFLHLPALSLGVNALLIGGLGAYYQQSGLGIPAYLAGTVPHGITELAALSVGCASGLFLCRATTYAATGHVNAKTVAQTLSVCLRAYVHWVVPLLAVSAFLEAFATPLLLNLFLPV